MVAQKRKAMVDEPATSLLSSTEEVNFPRGGASALSPLEHREIANKAAQDLFTTSPEKQTETTTETVTKKRRPNKNKKKPAPKETSSNEPKLKPIELLTFKQLTEGALLLGCISHISDLELIVALPQQLTGVVPITEISDPITTRVELAANAEEDEEKDDDDDQSELPDLKELFHLGQWVRCRVISVADGESDNQKKRIELSLKPEKVNADIAKVDVTTGMTLGAYVQSVEDHGYILSLGLKDLTGFCNNAEAKTYIEKYNRGQELVPGQLVECMVTKKSGNKRTVTVTLDHKKLAKGVLEEPCSRIASLIPGQLVEGVVETVQANGVIVKFMGLYQATISVSHMPAGTNVEESYKIGQKVQFRILYSILNVDQKKIAGSVLQHVLSLDSPILAAGKQSQQYVSEAFPYGTFLDNVTACRVTKVGVYVTIQGLEGVAGFIHISRLADEQVPSISANNGPYKLGSTHRARVLGYNPVDAMFLLTIQPSVLAEKFLRIEDIEVGSVIEATAQKLVDSGLIVNISRSMTALVPTHHLSDVKLSHPEIKFKPGVKVRARVMLTNAAKRKVLLTLKRSLIDSELPLIKDMKDVQPGMISHGVIVSLRSVGCVVGFYNNITAFAHISEMTETTVRNIADVFHVGQTVKARVINVDAENNKMQVSFINKKKEKKEKKEAKAQAVDEETKPGKLVQVTIKEIKKTQLNVSLPNGMVGRIHITEIYKDMDSIQNKRHPLRRFRSGTQVEARILGVRDVKLHTYLPISNTSKTKQTIECSLLDASDGYQPPRDIRNVKAGESYIGFIGGFEKEHALVHIGAHTTGIIPKQYISSDPALANDMTKHFIIGQAIKVAVLNVDAGKKSLKMMHQDTDDTQVIDDFDSLSKGQVVSGVIRKVDEQHGLLVGLNKKMAGKVHRTDLSDTFTDDPTAGFKVGQVVRCAVISIDAKNKRVDLSLRASRLESGVVPKNPEIQSVEDVKEGQILQGYVENIVDAGVFVGYGRQIRARVKIANLSDAFVKEWKEIYHVGQLVTSKVLQVDVNVKRIEASLKKSVVEGIALPKKRKASEEEEEAAIIDSEDEEMEDASESESDEASEDEQMEGQEEDDDEDEEMEEAQEENEEDEEEEEEEEDTEAPALSLSGFDWTGQTATTTEKQDSSDEEEESADEEEEATSKSKKPKQKKEVVDKTAELSTATPQSAADFERVLVGSPNSSFVWINYMAYQLRLSEIAKAREIGERALKTINFREEQEKLNVWVAMLNLENNFGSEETLDEVFKRALIYNEPKKVYLQLASIYERSKKDDKAEALWQEMTRKFSQSSKVWTLFGLFCLKRDNVEGARELLQRSLKSLPKHKHVKTIVKFAQMEFKHGEAERGRTIFEGVMGNYPKRVDLWNVYLDQEIRAGDQEIIRRLFERVTAMKYSSKKMKFLFKKWLQYEKQHGSEDDVERVKQKALAYVESKSN
ncbi:uncharacterized protein BYT42DRAFT_607950 [Radiomyces spectabilis]|uniref:uncharacterized protein n=1 Tax=Radiomyces spectabilis TaxID=64574 RepID=UPI00221F8142|nr:uncharacterized protein BYT42DRAFT_607950 [Radiomyces spectabilis]KAI8369582.1 hypothetical protein BYT42DRAFT_607950 [Radiomyces spectabilis]